MKVLVLGATGATGRLVVEQLLNRNVNVKAVVRNESPVLNKFKNNGLLEIITGNISDFNQDKNVDLVKDCTAVVCCLGHNLTFRGLFGKPRMLVRNSIINICNAVESRKRDNVKIILMNTTGNMNRKNGEHYSFKDRVMLSILNVLLPPQKDNVEAAGFLINTIGENNPEVEWTAVRPDTLINEMTETEYEVFESPKRSPVFDPGKTSRINTARFMVDLLLKDEFWNLWKFKMPVIYNKQ